MVERLNQQGERPVEREEAAQPKPEGMPVEDKFAASTQQHAVLQVVAAPLLNPDLFKPLALGTKLGCLGVLLLIQQQVPKLFSDATRHEINLFKLLEDQGLLMTQLGEQPGYLEAMMTKKPVSLRISPPKEGIVVQAKTIKAQAVIAWKEGLRQTLQSLTAANPIEELEKQITDLSKQAQPERLLNPEKWLLTTDKQGQMQFRDAMKAVKDAPIRDKLLKVKELYPQHANIGEIDKALSALDNQEKLAPLAELRAVLLSNPTSSNWEEAESTIDNLTAEDLIYLDDKDTLKNFESNLIDLVYKRIHAFASQEESGAQKTTSPVMLREVQPIMAIFRGCIGGDCSSRRSFPYPNDPHERVFFIEDINGQPKGYVTAIEVMSNEKKYLYIITVSGARVNAGDTELIFRGFYKAQAQLGVAGILLPESSKVDGLINYPEHRGRYMEYITGKQAQEIVYQHPEFRTMIEQCSSENNRGFYDYMSNNDRGVPVVFDRAALKNLRITLNPESWPLLKPEAVGNKDKRMLLEFIGDLFLAERLEEVSQIFEIREVKQLISEESLRNLMASLNPQAGASLKQFTEQVLNQLTPILGNSASDFLKRNSRWLFPQALQCTDAFSETNLEYTAQQTLGYLKDKSLPDKFWNLDFQNFSSTKAFSKWKAKFILALPDILSDENFKRLLQLKIQDPELIQKIASYLIDQNLAVRQAAIQALVALKVTDPGIYQQIAEYLEDSNTYVRQSAIQALVALKVTDPTIHQQIAGRLEDKDASVRVSAIQALADLKVIDSAIYGKLVKCLDNSNVSIRKITIYALANLKVIDSAIYGKLAKLLDDLDASVRQYAIYALENLNVTNPAIHQQIASCLNNSDASVCQAAIYALENLKVADAEIHQQIASCLHNSDAYVRQAAIHALANLKVIGSAIHEQIVNCLNDSDAYVRANATMALIQLRVKDFAEQIAGYLTNSDASGRADMIRVLGDLKVIDSTIHQQIASCINNQDNYMRRVAIEALVKLDVADSTIHQQIATYLTSPDYHVRTSAIEALVKLDVADSTIHQQIATCLNDENDSVVQGAAHALVRLNVQNLEIHKNIADCLRNTNVFMCLAAIQVLVKLGVTDKDILGQIAICKNDTNRLIRDAASAAMTSLTRTA